MSEPTAGPGTSGWLSLGPASELLGIDPDTLRRWADEGRVPAWTTPGGHRRFDADALNRLVAARRSTTRMPLTSLGASPERLTRVYQRHYASDERADEAERVAYRLAGRPKELVIVPNAGHVDLYDRVDLIPFDKLTRFFEDSLRAQ